MAGQGMVFREHNMQVPGAGRYACICIAVSVLAAAVQLIRTVADLEAIRSEKLTIFGNVADVT